MDKVLAQFDQLIDELTKEKPNESRIKNQMRHLGLPYKNDPIECLNQVLMALHPSDIDFSAQS